MHAKLLQSCQTLWDPMDCSLPGFSVCGILQARILEKVVIPSGPGVLPNPGIEPVSLMTPALAGRFFTTSATWEAHFSLSVLPIDILQIFILLHITVTHIYITVPWSNYVLHKSVFNKYSVFTWSQLSSVQFSSVRSLSHWVTLCNPMECSMPGFLVHQFLEITQTHVHWVGDAIQPSHPLSSPSPPTFNLSQHHSFLQWVSSSHQVAQVLELQHQSFQWILSTDIL